MKYLIKNVNAVTPSKTFFADILIEGEKITAIEKNISCDYAVVLDAKCLTAIPGAIDSHTHFDLFNGVTTSPDDFKTGSFSAIMGGTTTIIDYATQFCGETMREALSNWHNKAENKTSCDYAFHMALTEWNESLDNELENMFAEGVTSFKLYMAYDALRVNDEQIYKILKRVSFFGGIVCVHCENGDMINMLTSEQKEKGNTKPSSHPLCHPAQIEAEAVNRLLTIAELADTPVNIVHTTCTEALNEILRARARGVTVYTETCPQYLLLDDSNYSHEDFYESAKYVLAPPLRKKEDMESLWQNIANGNIDTIATDHCSFNLSQKALGLDDFSKIPNGIPGVEHRLPLIYTYGVLANKITLECMVKVLCENPAKLFGMYPKKGVLRVGSDADIVLLSDKATHVISCKTQHNNTDNTPFEGMKVTGVPEYVFLRGTPVVEKSKLVLTHCGKYIRRGSHLGL